MRERFKIQTDVFLFVIYLLTNNRIKYKKKLKFKSSKVKVLFYLSSNW